MIFRSDIYVEKLLQVGSDLDIARSAWVSSVKNPVNKTETDMLGLIPALLKQKHGSPFEEGYLSVHIEAPRAVRDEHVRHRSGSYSSSSLRYYMENESEVYVPGPNRPLKKAAGFKKMRPVYEPLTNEEYIQYNATMTRAYLAQESFDRLLVDQGFAETEMRRWITTDGHYVRYRSRFNPRQIMAFLALRTKHDWANHPSFPMWEINEVANQIEVMFAEHWPVTAEAFERFGREAP